MKDIQATGEASGPQNMAFFSSIHQNNTVHFSLFSFIVGHFCPPESGSGPGSRSSRPKPMLIWIHNTVKTIHFLIISMFCVFVHLHMDADCESGSSQQKSKRIRIHDTGSIPTSPTQLSQPVRSIFLVFLQVFRLCI
jgi:hypothetical protein